MTDPEVTLPDDLDGDYALVPGWTPDRQTRFLDHLAEKGNVSAACKRVKLSREAAYRLRRRDRLFARGWAAAMVKARDASIEVLADRAIEGVEEPIYHRGELIGTKRKYDTRLLLAHIARLDKAAEDEAAQADAGRFDELLARIAGEHLPQGLDSEDGVLPLERRRLAQKRASEALDEHYESIRDAEEFPDEAEAKARQVAADEAYHSGWVKAEQHHDQWFHNACDYVDFATGWLQDAPAPGLPGGPPLPPRDAEAEAPDFIPRTLSDVSTGALARALAGAEGRFGTDR